MPTTYVRKNTDPIRGELYSLEKLSELATKLAAIPITFPQRSRKAQLEQIKNNKVILEKLYKRFYDRQPEAYRTPAQEWFLDNYHLIADQLRGVMDDLSPQFYSELPIYTEGPGKGEPRVYELARLLVTHTDSQIDTSILKEVIRAFQSVSVLTTGELWAIAILLRLVLIENITRLMLCADEDCSHTDAADEIIEKMLAQTTADRQPEIDNLNEAIHTRLLLRLREKDQKLFGHFRDQLIERNKNMEELIWLKTQDLANHRVSVSNAIVSLRVLASIDWPEFIDSVSEVDRILRNDAAGVYEQCDFNTRDRYRHTVEILARHSDASEIEIAQLAVDLSEQNQTKSENVHAGHVGYYLIDEGRLVIEAATNFRVPFRLKWKRRIWHHPILFYQGAAFLLTILIPFLLARYAFNYSGAFLWGLFVFMMAIIPSSAISLTLMNWLVTILFRPEYMPRLEFKKGIPSEMKTLVVLPTLLTGTDEIQELTSRIEIHYLANNDDNLEFALLTDFTDADTPTTPKDDRLLQEARDKIAALNRKYPLPGSSRFRLFHRRRIWNPSEGKWMGWERKRGKLEEFNRLLLGKDHTSFEPEPVPQNIRFVITLDSDTILPRDAARKLVGIHAHPLVKPLFDPKLNRVTSGYGILQPRVSHTLNSANSSLFARAFSGTSGIDPYTRAVSDLYQDLFGEASFIGKGIYDLKAFYESTDERFPENTLLSHDLVEGAFARTALVSDIELFDDHPSDYSSYSIRHHRWVRGDWQAAYWLLRTLFSESGRKPREATISGLNAWKLMDNLRRSLVAPFLLTFFILGWTVLPGNPLYWTMFSGIALLLPILIPLISLFVGSFKTDKLLDHLRNVREAFKIAFNQALLTLAFLANDAWIHIDAITRTIFRILRHKKLLEWTTAAQAERSRSNSLAGYLGRMWHSQILSVLIFVIMLSRPEVISASAPVLIFWFFAPLLAWLTGLPIQRDRKEISTSTRYVFRSHARDCWRYFETFANEENHWLPGDNFQQDPVDFVAHRTSPTNIGFALLANVSAFDLGYIGAKDFVQRTELTLTSLARLSTFNGHLFNWYDTRTLEPLQPRYVSTVDSGNLAASLLTLRQFVLKEPGFFQPPRKRLEGIADDLTGFLRAAKKLKSYSELSVEIRTIRNELRRFLKHTYSEVAEQDLLLWLQKVLSLLAAQQTKDRSDQPEEEAWMRECQYWLESAQRIVASHLSDFERPQDLKQRLRSIARDAEALVQEMDFQFLYDQDRGLFSIGFNVTNGRLDTSYYDLFASESRLTSFVAIAKGDIPQSHWFRMGRGVTRGPYRMLVSWSGSMFEYLMPLLLIRNEPGTLWDLNYEKAVLSHREYASQKHVPWGISESAYNRRDSSMNYQYGPFGNPWLGLKRGLELDLVVSPYATFLAAMVEPDAARKNLEKFERMGAHGRFGFYESIDFTRERLPEGSRHAIVKAFMAHHLGMSLVSLNNVINANIMQKRFHSDPAIQAIDLLVQERVPATAGIARTRTVDERPQLFGVQEPVVAREFQTPFLFPPRTQILSNGRYSVMVSTSGSGYSEWNRVRVNRWLEDPTLDSYGTFFYLKDRTTGTLWSATCQPLRKQPDGYNVSFSEDKVEFRRRDGEIETHYDIIVTPDENAEIRRLTVVNTGSQEHTIDITSYSEITLALAANDEAHRTFSSLFVQTEFIQELGAVVANRPLDSRNKTEFWAAHVATVENGSDPKVEFETDRARFLGRNRTVENPECMENNQPLSGNVGAVLDPIFSLRRTLKIQPYSRTMIAFITVVGQSREEVLMMARHYREYRSVSRAFELASAHADAMLRQFSITRQDADLYQGLASRILFSNRSMRPRAAVLERNKLTQASLWPFGISGDLPICLVRVEETNDLSIVRQVLQAHEYWHRKGLLVDLVILNEFPTSYYQDLQEELFTLIRAGSTRDLLNKPGGIFVLRFDLMTEEDRVLLRSVARIEVHAQRGSLARQVHRSDFKDGLPAAHVPRSMFPIEDPPFAMEKPPLILWNGHGGFTQDGSQYRIRLAGGETTPAPWINVISNPEFGFQISESGAGMTWSVNSRENRLTSFSNDPVSDPVDSVIYLRDEETGKFWSVTPTPVRGNAGYEIVHGAGYSIFQNGSYGLEQKFITFVPLQEPVRILQLSVRNHTKRTREISATFYCNMVLGFDRSRTAHSVFSSVDTKTGAMLIRNPYNNEFASRVAFSWVNDEQRTVTGDRNEFLGSCGSIRDPAAMHYESLSGHVGPGLDPCAAIQTKVKLSPYSEHVFLFLLGQGSDLNEVRSILQKFSRAQAPENALVEVQNFWKETLGTIQVETPDPQFNVMMNHWLLYQALSCRFWARSALYQSGGAYGFRDQLQDSLGFIYSRPELTRSQLLRAASRQFVEGDVQHWWHPPTGKGVRTQISDDLLWLPYCTAFYCHATGDFDILDLNVPFLKGRALDSTEHEAYFEPEISDEEGTLLEHCLRAIDRSLRFGPHGLPLIGSGDWNDGFNRVGIEGRGESIWLGWFLIKILNDFSALCSMRGENQKSEHYKRMSQDIQNAIQEEAWDGKWFIRCFHDDGTIMGSASSVEGQIDSIAQSWSILSGGGEANRSQTAMDSVQQKLLLRNEQLVLLFTPPYGSTDFDPGYIRDYPAGIRENGGQYNHAVAWLIMAYSRIGKADQAYELMRMMNPAYRSHDPESASRYRLEPYAVAADIYSHPSHMARGGWSWYTGSASWLYRACLESILGLEFNRDSFSIRPAIPSRWKNVRITLKRGSKTHEIQLERSGEEIIITIDGQKTAWSPARQKEIASIG